MAKELYCNKCGKKLGIWDIQQDFSWYGGFNYGSKYEDDSYEIDLCCSCMDEFVESCKISPIKKFEY